MRKQLLFNSIKFRAAIIAMGISSMAQAQSSGCNPLQPYDQIQSGFHTTIASRPDGTFLIWGAGSTANGNGTANLNKKDVSNMRFMISCVYAF